MIETVWTIGYERLPPDMLVAELQTVGIRRVIEAMAGQDNQSSAATVRRAFSTPTSAMPSGSRDLHSKRRYRPA